MIPLCIPNISGNEGAYLAECVESTFVSTVGPFVNTFEEMIAAASGASRAVATSAGTTALHAILHHIGVGPGDHVIIPALTFIATANAVSHCHGTPIIADVDEERWGLDPIVVEDILRNESTRDAQGVLRLDETGGAIKAIMPVFAMGLPADMDALRVLADEFDLFLVADAAAAIGARYKTRPLAQMGADYTAVSFNGNKLITAGGGGAILCPTPEAASEIKHLTSTARVGGAYDHDIVGFNYRMTNLQAAVGVAQLERLEDFLQAKKRISNRYEEAFSGIRSLLPFPSTDESEGSLWLSGIYAPMASLAQMDALRAQLVQTGIEGRTFWKPIHQQTPYLACPVALTGRTDKIWQRVQPLPCSTQLTSQEQEQVIDVVKSCFA